MAKQHIDSKNWLTSGTLLVFVLALFLVIFPLLILVVPVIILFNLFGNKTHTKKYNAYLQSIDGTNFFCYNNRTNSKDFIEKHVLPILAPDIKVIYLNGRTPESDYDQTYISTALYRIRDKKGFPYLLKITDGQLIDKSINNDLYNTMNLNKDIGQLAKTMSSFYKSN